MLHKNIEENTNNQNITKTRDDLKNIIVSLLYLSQEARSSSLDYVEEIIQKAIGNISSWTVENQDKLPDIPLDQDTVNTLSFVHQFSLLSTTQRLSVASALKEAEKNYND